MKTTLIGLSLLVLVAVLAYAADEHPVEMGNLECISCHSDPETVSDTSVVSQYNQSLHSYSGVACGNCHGDEKNFQIKPPKSTCEPCHTQQVMFTNSPLACENCHIPHTYNVHKRP